MTADAPGVFGLGGAMGAAPMMGLGLALAQPQRRVLVVTGDGELLMNLGALASIAVMAPGNLALICVDNAHYGETGNQDSHTGLGVRLDRIAAGAGFPTVATINTEAELHAAKALLREDGAPRFILLRVKDGPPPRIKREMQPAILRTRFRAHALR
ncbi:MAG: aldehyde dehydrogenase [Rhodospirillales bacterium]|nr:aldehyde dehydrogenase [Rhodospirillales bacterium]